jgi:5-methylcytosine-specific restriction endonuclease McrA
VTDTNAFRHAPRERLTDQERAKLFLDRKGKCHRCTRKIMHGEKWSDEHVIALENGGTNAWENRDISCSWCKPLKDGEDHKKAAKTRAVAVANIIPPSQRQKKGRPIPGSKRSGFKKKMNGEVVRR